MFIKAGSQDISWFLDQNERGLLDLDPPYQRKSVWSAKDRKYFLDTIFNGYPSPPIYLHKEMDDEGKSIWHVVDGKQRLSTIINFAKNKIALDKDYGDERFAGKRWKSFSEHPELKKKFWDYTFTVQVLPEVDLEWIRDVFDRLNRNSKNLERQELRHAKYDGWLIKYVEGQANNIDWKTLKVVTAGRAKRMKDVQFLSELAKICVSEGLSGFDQDDLDQFHADYDNIPNDQEEFDLEYATTSPDTSFFNEDEFSQRFDSLRQFLIELENLNQSITEYANTYIHFYSIWGVLALSGIDLEDINKEALSVKYKNFMEKVKKVSEIKNLDNEALLDIDKDALKYYQASRGASTDFPQREARHEALCQALLE